MFTIADKGAAIAAASLLHVAQLAVGAVEVTCEAASDVSSREALLDRAFGPGRHLKTSARLRRGRVPACGLSLMARDADSRRMLGTVRLWNVALGDGVDGDGRSALLLGPLAVDVDAQSAGIGAKLMRYAIAEAAFRGHAAIILVGDPEYYERFGFSAECVANLRLPGPVEQRRFLGLDLRTGALAGTRGLVRATGAMAAFAANDASVLGLAV